MRNPYEFEFGEIVRIPWGLGEVRARVHEIYGEQPRRYVVVMLSPELSNYVVDEDTTLSLHIDSVRPLEPSDLPAGMSEPDLGERVLINWGPRTQVLAEVTEVYGAAAGRHVLVRLTPEISSDVVDRPTTLSVPLHDVEQVETA